MNPVAGANGEADHDLFRFAGGLRDRDASVAAT